MSLYANNRRLFRKWFPRHQCVSPWNLTMVLFALLMRVKNRARGEKQRMNFWLKKVLFSSQRRKSLVHVVVYESLQHFHRISLFDCRIAYKVFFFFCRSRGKHNSFTFAEKQAPIVYRFHQEILWSSNIEDTFMCRWREEKDFFFCLTFFYGELRCLTLVSD